MAFEKHHLFACSLVFSEKVMDDFFRKNYVTFTSINILATYIHVHGTHHEKRSITVNDLSCPNHNDFQAKYQGVEQWLSRDLNAQYRAQLETVIGDHLQHCFGVYRLHIGPGSNAASRIPASMSRTLVMGVDSNHQVLVDPLALPVVNESIQALVIHFLFDMTTKPHELIREAARIVMPGGKIVVCGLNPNCVWGFRNNLHNRVINVPSMSPKRLKDWFTLLHFKVTKLDYSGHRLAINNRQWFTRTDKIIGINKAIISPFGAFYTMSAVKHEPRYIGGVNRSKIRPRLSFVQVPKSTQCRDNNG